MGHVVNGRGLVSSHVEVWVVDREMDTQRTFRLIYYENGDTSNLQGRHFLHMISSIFTLKNRR